jgi:phenylpropionate dioxygenase-like ring-hydroxylating dioxygenase large terminal subunit
VGLLRELNKIRGGWPGGWKQYARGYINDDTTPPFAVPENPDDRRSLIPPLGLKEYWFPAIPDKDVGWKKPVGLKIGGEDLVLFRGKDGEVKALWDYCPHRGAYLSWGDCFWKGFVSCPYHGATFDGNGECVEFITEGPDSKMVGRVQAKKYPTVTLKGVVFVWMGEGEPVDPKEDLPPEFFEDESTLILSTFRYWHCNWMIALENTSDAHNCFYVHRDSLTQLRTRTGGRPRTPLGYPSKIINNKSVTTEGQNRRPGQAAAPGVQTYYADDKGNLPYQLYYPRVGGNWPLHKKRLLWTWAFEWGGKVSARWNKKRFETPQEWQGMRLPGMQRLNFGPPGGMYTRWCVPVEENLTRAVYFRSIRTHHALTKVWEKVSFATYRNWFYHYNFSDQDYDAMRSCRYQYPEYLSATDSHLVAERRLITEHARGINRNGAVNELTTAEKLVLEAHELQGVHRTAEEDYAFDPGTPSPAPEIAVGGTRRDDS